jgi:hypothetical protein
LLFFGLETPAESLKAVLAAANSRKPQKNPPAPLSDVQRGSNHSSVILSVNPTQQQYSSIENVMSKQKNNDAPL